MEADAAELDPGNAFPAGPVREDVAPGVPGLVNSRMGFGFERGWGGRFESQRSSERCAKNFYLIFKNFARLGSKRFSGFI